MPTLKDLKKRVEFLIDDTIDYDLLVQLANEALEDLSEVTGYEKTAKASFYKDDPVIALPLDLIKIVEIKMKRLSDKGFNRMEREAIINDNDIYGEVYPSGYFSYEEFGDSIELKPVPKEDGQLLIRYYADLPPFKDETAFKGETDPLFQAQLPTGLPTRFHNLLALFASKRYWQNWKDEPQQVNELDNEYMMGKGLLAEITTKRKYKNRSKTVKRYSDFL